MMVSRVASLVIISKLLLIILTPAYCISMNKYVIVSFSPIFIKITMKLGVAYHQLPVKYPQFLALLIGPIETLMWYIGCLHI